MSVIQNVQQQNSTMQRRTMEKTMRGLVFIWSWIHSFQVETEEDIWQRGEWGREGWGGGRDWGGSVKGEVKVKKGKKGNRKLPEDLKSRISTI